MMDDPREKRLAQMQKDCPFPVVEDVVNDDIRAKAGLGPLARSAQQGIQDMQKRLEVFERDKTELLKRMDTAIGEDFKALEQLLNNLNRSIQDAEARLVEYQTQGKGLN